MTSLFYRGVDGGQNGGTFCQSNDKRRREVLKSQDKLKTTFMENPRTYYYTAKSTYGRKGGKGA